MSLFILGCRPCSIHSHPGYYIFSSGRRGAQKTLNLVLENEIRTGAAATRETSWFNHPVTELRSLTSKLVILWVGTTDNGCSRKLSP